MPNTILSALKPASGVLRRARELGDDITVVKHRISAFAGTDLDMILRAKDIDVLILTGFRPAALC